MLKEHRDELRDRLYRATHVDKKEAIAWAIEISGENRELTVKEAEEVIEQAWVLKARDVCAKQAEGASPKDTFRSLVALYQEMPTLGTRSSSSMIGQAYSTPIPIAYIMSLLAGVHDLYSHSPSVWEPTPGNGNLLINLQSPYRAMGLEIDPVRHEFVSSLHQYIQKRDWLTEPFSAIECPPGGFEIAIGNPPFGSVDRRLTVQTSVASTIHVAKMDLYVMLQSLAFLAVNGRAAFLIGSCLARQKGSQSGTKSFYRSRDNVIAWRWIMSNFKVTHHVAIHGKLYARQGASFPVDLIVVSGRGQTHGGLPGSYIPQLISTWDELAEIKPLHREYTEYRK